MTDQNLESDNQNQETQNGDTSGQTSGITEAEIQKKIDAAVKNRVAREKEYQKTKETEWEEERKALQEENDFLKKQFQAKIDEQLTDVPASFRSLVSKLPIREQIQWLAEQQEEKSKTPKTPSMPNFDKKSDDKGKDFKPYPIERVT